MRKAILLSAAVLLAGVVLAEDTKDTPKLNGTWEASSATNDGKEMAAEGLKKLRLTVKDGSYTYETPKGTLKGTIKFDASKTPKEVDVTRDTGSSRKGIYKLTDDTFEVCFAAEGKERPTEFSAKAGSGNSLTVWKKVK
jgi:uncharacterized protein (TIGR03067 family)